MMSVLPEMERGTNLTTEVNHPHQEDHHLHQFHHHHPRKGRHPFLVVYCLQTMCVTTSVLRQEDALSPMLDHQELVKALEVASLLNLVEIVLELQMNVKIAIKLSLVLLKKNNNQLLIQEQKEAKLPETVTTNVILMEPKEIEAAL